MYHGGLVWAGYAHTFACNLRATRKRRGISQQLLAELSGVSRNQISNLERNNNNATTMADPQLSTVYKLAMALRVPPVVLLPAMDVPETFVASVKHVAPFSQEHVDQQLFLLDEFRFKLEQSKT